MSNKKKHKTIEELTAGYANFIKGKKVNSNGKELFDKVVKKAVKQRGSK